MWTICPPARSRVNPLDVAAHLGGGLTVETRRTRSSTRRRPLTPTGQMRTGEAKGSPTDRLKRVQDAFDKGQINEREYRQLRSDILKDF